MILGKIKVGGIEVEKYFCKPFKISMSLKLDMLYTYATVNKESKTD